MAGISSIYTDWGPDPRIVRVVTSDTLFAITEYGYLTAQASNIQGIQNGNFQWLPDDGVYISYAGGEGLFTVDLVNNCFKALSIARFVALTVSAAELALLYASPLLIVPAQGPYTWITGNSPIVFEYDYGTAQYTGGGALGLQYDSTAHLAGTAASTTEAAATINGFTDNEGFTLLPAATGTMTSMVNKGIYLSNATGAFATGDGSLTINYSYNVVNTLAS